MPTRIEDMTLLPSPMEAKDIFALQRPVLGIQTDYYAECEDYFGAFRLFRIEWDGVDPLDEYIYATTPGDYILPISVWCKFTPGASPGFATGGIQVANTSASSAWTTNISDWADPKLLPFQTPIGGGPPYVPNDEIQVSEGNGGFDGTFEIFVLCIEKTPI